MSFTLTNNGGNIMLDELGTVALKIAIYNDDETPTKIGSSQSISWNSASNGQMTMYESDIIFNVPSGETVRSVVLFNSTETVQYLIYTLEGSYYYSNAGTFTITNITLEVN